MNWQTYFRAPFTYDSDDQSIFDANGTKVLDVRGWGHLTGRGACNLSNDVAMCIQDNFGEHVAQLLNSPPE